MGIGKVSVRLSVIEWLEEEHRLKTLRDLVGRALAIPGLLFGLDRARVLMSKASATTPFEERRRLRDALSAPNLTRPPLPSEAHARLLLVFREYIIKLQELLGRDLSGWLK